MGEPFLCAPRYPLRWRLFIESMRNTLKHKRGASRMPSCNRSPEPQQAQTAPLPCLRQAAASCKACDLWKAATQTVFGEGRADANIMLVGEQPGDLEDRAGRPFVGPAGKPLDQALVEAGIDRFDVYVTNVVKHFQWSPAARGEQRVQ